MKGKLPVTVIFITLNEEFHLEGVLKNIQPWAQEIYIVDSLSNDKTVDIALKYNVKLIQRPFTNFSDQWNFALNNLPISTKWTLKLDPDERVTPRLLKSMTEVMESEYVADGYSFKRRLWFMGNPIHVYSEVVRLWKTGSCVFSDVIVNERPLINGKVERLKGFLEHLDSKNLHHWYEKQNRYSTMEAIMKFNDAKLSAEPNFLGNKLERQMFVKKFFFKIPFKYFFIGSYLYLMNGLWRDGVIGRKWIECRKEYYRMIEKKFLEIKITGDLPVVKPNFHGNYDERVLQSELQKKVMGHEE